MGAPERGLMFFPHFVCFFHFDRCETFDSLTVPRHKKGSWFRPYRRMRIRMGSFTLFTAQENANASLFFHTVLIRKAHVAQLVEHVLGKDEVTGSIPVMGSMNEQARALT
jgi:hypothetical protein